MQRRRKSRILSSKREDELDGLAEIIVSRYFPSGGKITPRVIADDYGIAYDLGDYGDDFDGLLFCEDDEFHIFVNKERQQSPLRQRFTFCHELGHFLIDGHRNALLNGEVPYYSSFTGFASEQVVEREADFFASCLLMPKKRTIRDYRQHRKFSYFIIKQLAEKYQMSEIATLYRILYLDLHPLMIVKAQSKRIVSIQRSDDFYHFPIDGMNSIPEDSLMFEALHQGKQRSKTEQIWIGDWFRSDKSEGVLYEHCIYYEQYDLCYSILWED